jgi:hypothetical protein
LIRGRNLDWWAERQRPLQLGKPLTIKWHTTRGEDAEKESLTTNHAR